MRIRWGLFTLLLAVTAAIGAPPAEPAKPGEAKLERLQWLLGSWKRETKTGAIHETWTGLGDRVLEGKSTRIDNSGGVRIPLEDLLLVQMGGEVFYISKVDENPYPVAFRLTELAERSAVFENPTHDFPQRIVYELRDDGTLHAYIEGPGAAAGGPPRRIEFPFVRSH